MKPHRALSLSTATNPPPATSVCPSRRSRRAFFLLPVFYLGVAQAVATIQGQFTSCASSISQAAGLAALCVGDEEMQTSFDVMREKVNNATPAAL